MRLSAAGVSATLLTQPNRHGDKISMSDQLMETDLIIDEELNASRIRFCVSVASCIGDKADSLGMAGL